MSSESPPPANPLVRRVGTVLVAMMTSAIAATAIGSLLAAEIVRGFGIVVMVGTPFAALVRIALYGAARRERMLVLYPLGTLVVVIVAILIAW